MTEALAKRIGPLEVGEEFDFYIGLQKRRAQIREKQEDGLVLNMVDGGNPNFKTSIERLRESPVYRTVEEGPKPLSYKGE